MKTINFEEEIRKYECYHQYKVLPNTWIVIRVDGKGFSKLTANMEKPFSPIFSSFMEITTTELVDEFNAIYGYSESDEISILLPLTFDSFDRKVEKLVSISAGIASATFTKASALYGVFDSRIIVLPSVEKVVDYFRWRQNDATRCALNGYCYWTARQQDKMTVSKATSLFNNVNVAFKNEFLFQHGINFNDLPLWRRRGFGLYKEEYLKKGYNPKEKIEVEVMRRRIVVDRELGKGLEYENYIRKIIENNGVLSNVRGTIVA
jgi:tRNA(His) 5'-end guanylyltransferase